MQVSVAQLQQENNLLKYKNFVQVNSIQQELERQKRVCDTMRQDNEQLRKENRKLRLDNTKNMTELQNFQRLTQMVQNQLATLRGHIQNLQTQNEQLARENRTLRQMHGG